MRDSMVFYRSFYEAVKDLPDEEFGKALRAILAYALDDDDSDPEGTAKIVFTMAKPQIDMNNKRYRDGSKGGRPKKSDGSDDNPNQKTSGYENKKPVVSENAKNKKPNVNVNDNENVNVNDNVNDNDNVNVNENENHKGRKAPVSYYPNDEKLDQAFRDYVAMRRSIKKPMTDRAVTLAMNELSKLADQDGVMDNDLAVKILEQSILNSWQGLFPLKEESPPRGKSSILDEWRKA